MSPTWANTRRRTARRPSESHFAARWRQEQFRHPNAHQIGELHERRHAQVLATGLHRLEVLERYAENLLGEPLLGHPVSAANLGHAATDVFEHAFRVLLSHWATVGGSGRNKNHAIALHSR